MALSECNTTVVNTNNINHVKMVLCVKNVYVDVNVCNAVIPPSPSSYILQKQVTAGQSGGHRKHLSPCYKTLNHHHDLHNAALVRHQIFKKTE